MIIPKCDECGSIDFDIKSTDPNSPTTYVVASEYFKALGLPLINDCLMRYHSTTARCKKCGAEYHYTTPY